ncbi:MAG: LacI family DNA-binding transcriptional regulator [Oceanospirillaceae bacterium]|nr:LacI family DNA-binding transcriptional regulator [Oceanospirillaceae bacterium]
MVQSGSKKKSRSKGKTTLNDIAKLLNISAITVSRALNTPDKVSEKLRLKVIEAVSQLGYVPNRAAKSLATNSTNTIAVVIPSISNTVFNNVVKGIYDISTDADFDLLFANTYYSTQKEDDLIAKLLAQHPDGIIVTGLDLSERSEQQLKSAGIPVVQIMEVGYSKAIDLNVGISHIAAGKMMAEYLISKNYRHIGFIGAQMDYRSQRRMKGFLNTLEAAAVDSYLQTTQVPSSVRLGGELLADLITEHPHIDAVFCNNDDIAYGAIYECQRRNIAIPRQVAIAGFNDLDASACINPSLTSIKTPLYEMGQCAAELLIRRIKNLPIKETCIDLGIELKIRDSA